ncbi:Cytochrome P450 [Dillenia turbinata]|uniref:Cytochrome P450 n=1 Tax=Dillenia turbinata TaxID=194707 RepID=A0AAN8V0M7_9MAGN
MAITMTKLMNMSPTMSSSSSSSLTSTPTPAQTVLPVRTIPGSYGWPLLGPISDRLDYFWFQGPETFFRKRVEKYKSTVFRTNMPPTFPLFINVNPNVIAVLDCKSFSHLFDMDIVEKRNVLVGDFMPSVKFTGDIRVCAYLDPSEEQHTKVKNFAMDTLKRSSKVWVSEFLANLEVLWDTLEEKISSNGSASYFVPLQKCLFNFLIKSIIGADPAKSQKISESGYLMIDKWLALQLLPTTNVSTLQPLPEIFLHSFTYPFLLVKGNYEALYEFVEKEGQEMVQRGQTEFGLTKEETIHNLLFILGFNAYGGFSIFLPTLISTIGSDTELQKKLREEVKEKLGSTAPSYDSIKNLELVWSVVYETLRLNPPVPLQYARARKDFQLSSHDSIFEVKKGELLCGYQKLVMRDPKVFNDPENFVSDRFMNDTGLLKYLYWSNGPETGSPGESNKQCAGKDYVVLTAVLFVAYVFQRYSSFTYSSSAITAVEKA